MQKSAGSGVVSRFLFALIPLAAILHPETSGAAPATQLVVSNDPCLIQVCPQPPRPPPKVVVAGESFPIFVAALDAGFAIDSSYRGTINLTATDPLATLPPPYTFIEADQGGRGFIIVLRSGGPQTITATDTRGTLTPGSLTMMVTAPVSGFGIPTLTGIMQIIFGLLLATVAVWICQTRR